MPFKPQDIYKQDRFYVDPHNGVIRWMYHNPDAVSGDQFVTNKFDKKILIIAVLEYWNSGKQDYDVGDVFDYIGSICRQYCSDVGTDEYVADKMVFESTPFAVGLTHDTVEKLMGWD